MLDAFWAAYPGLLCSVACLNTGKQGSRNENAVPCKHACVLVCSALRGLYRVRVNSIQYKVLNSGVSRILNSVSQSRD